MTRARREPTASPRLSVNLSNPSQSAPCTAMNLRSVTIGLFRFCRPGASPPVRQKAGAEAGRTGKAVVTSRTGAGLLRARAPSTDARVSFPASRGKKGPSMSHLRLRPLLLAAVLALMLPLGADAAASTNTAVSSQSGDGATLTLSAKAKRAFSGQHVSLTAQRPATRATPPSPFPTVPGSGTLPRRPARSTSRAFSTSPSGSARWR